MTRWNLRWILSLIQESWFGCRGCQGDAGNARLKLVLLLRFKVSSPKGVGETAAELSRVVVEFE
jgi:hypothetical protein